MSSLLISGGLLVDELVGAVAAIVEREVDAAVWRDRELVLEPVPSPAGTVVWPATLRSGRREYR